jgi:hypothetical protein
MAELLEAANRAYSVPRRRVCGDLWRNSHTRMKSPDDAVRKPRFRPHYGSSLGRGPKLGMRHVLHPSCQELVRSY